MPDFAGIPGSNPAGVQNTIPAPTGGTSGAIGNATNPLSSATAMPTGTSGIPTTSALAGLSPTPSGSPTVVGPGQSGSIGGLSTQDLLEAFRKAGYSSGDATLIAQFLEGGAGYSPQVAQAMIAALGPQIEQGQANILEQFGSQGLRMSSPAAYGMASFNSQVVLDEGQILSQLYEQSVQNYMEVIMAGKRGGTQPTTFGSLMAGGGIASGLAGAGSASGGGGGGSQLPMELLMAGAAA